MATTENPHPQKRSISFGRKHAHSIPYQNKVFEQIWGNLLGIFVSVFEFFDFFFKNETFALEMVTDFFKNT